MQMDTIKTNSTFSKVVGVLILLIGLFAIYLALYADYELIYRITLFWAGLFVIIIGLIKLGIVKPHRGGGLPGFS